MMRSVKSLEDCCLIKICTLIVCNVENKKEILCVPGSLTNDENSKKTACILKEKFWIETIKAIVEKTFIHLKIPKMFQQLIHNSSLYISKRMLTYVRYLEDNFNLSRDTIVNCFDIDCFDSLGTIDVQSVARRLVNNADIGDLLRYQILCFYLIEVKDLPWDNSVAFYAGNLWKRVPKKRRSKFYTKKPKDITSFEMIQFWNFYFFDFQQDHDCMIGESFFQRGFVSAIKRGNFPVVKFCWQNFREKDKQKYLLRGAMILVDHNNCVRFNSDQNRLMGFPDFSTLEDYVLFKEKRYGNEWVPGDFLADIFFFLFKEMSEENKRAFFKANVSRFGTSKVLEYCLFWPYQGHFLEVANWSWEILPENSFAQLLVSMALNLEAVSYDLRTLLWYFWCLSPESHKRAALDKRFQEAVLKAVLIDSRDFTAKDEEFVEMYVKTATPSERMNFISSYFGKIVCLTSFSKTRFDLANKFIKWNVSNELEFVAYKKELFSSSQGKEFFKNFILEHGCEKTSEMLKHYFNSEEEINAVKIRFCYEDGLDFCEQFIIHLKYPYVEKFLSWCFSYNTEEIVKFRNLIPEKDLFRISKKILNVSKNSVSSEEKFINVESFLNWIRPTEDVVAKFKKSLSKQLDSNYPWNNLAEIYLDLTIFGLDRVEDTDYLFRWVGLSDDDVKEFKRECLFSAYATENFLIINQANNLTTGLPNKGWKELESFIRRCLAEKEAVVGFQTLYSESVIALRNRVVDPEIVEKINLICEKMLAEI